MLKWYKKVSFFLRSFLFGFGIAPLHCRHTPSCSEYAVDVIKKRGIIIGGWLAGKRLLSCHL